MILVGEPHPELPLESLIQSLDLASHVRVLGFRPIEEFVGYLAACDIVLNLRYPTVGENSGTLMRALGLGKAVIVSEVGSFCELPIRDLPEGAGGCERRGSLFEYLNLLVSRPELRRELGARARAWVESECTWPNVAQRYADFLERSRQSIARPANRRSSPEAAGRPPAERRVEVQAEYILSWAPDQAAAQYVETHLTRFEKTLAITPPRRARGSYSRNGRLSANHARAQDASGLRRGARLLLWTRWPGGPSHRDIQRRRANLSATSSCSTPRRIAFPMRTGISPRSCAASWSST